MEEEKTTFGAIMDQLRCEAEIDKVAAKAAQAEAEAARAASLAALVAHQAVVHTHTERMGVAEQARSRMEGKIHALQVGGDHDGLMILAGFERKLVDVEMMSDLQWMIHQNHRAAGEGDSSAARNCLPFWKPQKQFWCEVIAAAPSKGTSRAHSELGSSDIAKPYGKAMNGFLLYHWMSTVTQKHSGWW